MTDDVRGAAAETYARFLQDLKPETIDRLDELAVSEMRFRDPFNDFAGRDRFKALLRSMYEDLEEPQFKLLDGALGRGTVYLRWTLRFRLRAHKTETSIDGVSEVHFDDKGLVIAQIDHWDAGSQFYEKLPMLGWFIRRVKRRMEG